MLFQTLAYKPSRCLALLLLWTTALVGVVHAQETPKISNEILNFVPTCAQSCLQSFIVTNFGSSGCGNSPSMPCLCTKTGASGHTIGEGAMACVVAEGQRGTCGGEDTETDKLLTAYNMCVGVANAAPKTHSTLVATIIAPLPSRTSSPPSTTSTSTPAQDLTTLVPTPSVSDTVTPSPDTTSPSGTSLAVAPETDSAAAQSQPQLSSAQIAGIVLGCLAVVVLGIVLIFLAKCARRKRFPDPEAAGGFTKMRDSLSFGGKKSAANSPPQLQISKPMVNPSLDLVGYPWQTTMKTSPPQVAPAQRPRTPQPLGVGLALSPHRRQPSADGATIRSVQRSTPAVVLSPPQQSQTQTLKIENAAQQRPPTLTLAIPAGAGPKKLPPPPVAANARDSIVTEFAEDGEGESASGTSANIWRPPPTDPQSATTYYFADKHGNWVLRSRKSEIIEPPPPAVPQPPPAAANAELPSPEDRTKAERAQGFSGWFTPGAIVPPLRVPSREHATKLGSPIAFQEGEQQRLQAPERRDIRSSSVYSPYPNGPVSILPGPSNPLPGANAYLGRDITPAPAPPSKSRRRSMRNSRPGRRTSTGSTTSIESAAFEEDDEPDLDLSPVVESPRSPVSPISPGQSPVTYPRIHARSKMSPAPAFPLPPNRPYGLPVNPQARKMNNTISTMPPARGQQQQQQQYWGGAGKRRDGPSPRQPPFELSGEDVRRPPQQQQQQQAYWGQAQQQQQRPQQQYQAWRPPRPGPHPVQQQRRLSAGPQQQQQRYPPPPQPQAYVPGANLTMSPTPLSAGTQQQHQQQRYPSAAQTNRTQSSDVLPPGNSMRMATPSPTPSSLAKRRGADAKVVGLALGGGEVPAAAKKQKKQQWKREDEDMAPPPVTPGIRMMTPTRKGEDLFLDVGR